MCAILFRNVSKWLKSQIPRLVSSAFFLLMPYIEDTLSHPVIACRVLRCSGCGVFDFSISILYSSKGSLWNIMYIRCSADEHCWQVCVISHQYNWLVMQLCCVKDCGYYKRVCVAIMLLDNESSNLNHYLQHQQLANTTVGEHTTQQWLGNDLPPLEWGWQKTDNDLPIAPEKVFNQV